MSRRPPRLAEWVITRTLPGGEDREVVLGDLAEEFDDITGRRGEGPARSWYWRQVLRSIVPNLVRAWSLPLPGSVEKPPGGVMESLLQDIRYGLRMLGRRPTFAAVGVLSLVIGIALSTVVFSLLNAVLLRPLPVRDPDSLAVVLEQRKDGVAHNFSYPDFEDYRAAQHTFDGMAAYSRTDVSVRHSAGSQVVPGELVSGDYFDLLGVGMKLGRALSPDDHRSGAAAAAVVSETLWRQIAGQSASFTSHPVVVNDREFAIVGVVRAPFRGMEVGRDVRIWMPLQAQGLLDPRDAGALRARGMSWLTVIGRLRPGVGLAQGGNELTAVEASLARERGQGPARTLTLATGRQGDSSLPATTGGPLKLLFGAALLVLVVACANVSNLLLVRATERTGEMAVRSALGAGRGRLARLVLIEALLLAVLGGGMAMVAARWLGGIGASFISSFGEPVTLDMSFDWRLVLFVAAVSLAATLIAGLAPLGAVFRASNRGSLSHHGRSSPGPATTRTHRVLLVGQFALSLALVAAAVLLGRTVHNLRTVPTGLDMEHVALIGVDPVAAQMPPARAAAYFESALQALAAQPGVRAAAFGRVIPLGFGGSRTTIAVPGYQPAAEEDMEINLNTVSPGYFDTLGIAIREGRAFDQRDVGGRRGVLIVNETMARRYWPGRRAVGQRVVVDPGEPPLEVVGVVPDVKYRMLREASGPSFYLPLAQAGASRGVLHVRTEGDPRAHLQTLRRTLNAVDPSVPVTSIRTLRDQATLNMNDERLAMLIGLTLGVAALVLSAVGLYGSMSYLVGQRTRELGVRIALGATAADLRRTVLGEGVRISAIGALLGVALALPLARMIESRLFGVSARDPLTLAGAAILLAATALLASWAPARRAAGVDPLRALRNE
jgi:predicted permease